MLRKLILTTVVLFVERGSLRQIALALVVAVTFMTLQVKYEPFKSLDEDNLQIGSLISLSVTLLGSILMKDKDGGTMVDVVVLMVNVFVVGFGLLLFLRFTIPGYKALMTVIWKRLTSQFTPDDEHAQTGASDSSPIDAPRVDNLQSTEPAAGTEDLAANVPVEKNQQACIREKVHKAVDTLFARYDLDGSGTVCITAAGSTHSYLRYHVVQLNSGEEVRMLAYNTSFRLKLLLDPEHLQVFVSFAVCFVLIALCIHNQAEVDLLGDVSDTKAMTRDSFVDWFCALDLHTDAAAEKYLS